jgi:hypothetical protein
MGKSSDPPAAWLATKGLYAAAAHSAVSWPEPLTAAQKNLAALHDLAAFEPRFLLQAMLHMFAAAPARQARRIGQCWRRRHFRAAARRRGFHPPYLLSGDARRNISS